MPQKPPATPSPHRFLKGQRRNNYQSAKASRPASALREQVTRAPPAQNGQTPTTSSQFAARPRFGVGKPKPKPLTQRSPSPQKPSLITALRHTQRPIEDVEDVPDRHEDEEMLDVLPTTEQNEDRQWTNDIAFSPKRRRLDNDHSPPVAPASAFKRPHQPAARTFESVPPPDISQGQSENASTSTGFGSAQRPAFIRPSAPPQAPSEPLPETFSPHKRGQKFVSGGMAATVQQWVIEAGQAAAQSRRGHGYLKGENYVMRVKLDQVLGEGPFSATGKDADGNDVRLLLAGKAQGDGEAARVSEGDAVGVRAPTWKVELERGSRSVAVDWRVLS